MIYYLQRECNLQTAIPTGGILQFDTPVALNATNPSTATEVLQYQEDGSIDIVSPGTYAVFWFVTGMTGFATDGQSYGLKRMDYSGEIPGWAVLAKSTNHIKNSSTPGFSLVMVSDEEISEYEKATIALFNTADEAIKLTFFSPKAGILIFGLDLDALEDRLSGINQEIADLFLQLQSIEDFVRLSAVTEVWSLSADLSGLGVAVINSGYTYNFWGIGTLNHQQTLESGETYYLIESSQFQPLTLYQGSSTIGTLWIETPAPASSVYSIPVRFDGSGIYFTPSTTISNLPVGTTFKFTQALILV
ncbi:MAG: hypothetical protein FWF85_08285 [Clostridiales bacterium]|jgi:hypothetical protein|nr:hypothetical protein [Clostridiales bacterium]MDR2712863.1 hypothetical protein [Clostridiales bacterium]